MEEFKPKLGKVYNEGGKLFAICGECGSWVQLNKPIIGSMHQCISTSDKVKRQCDKLFQKQSNYD